MAMPRDYNELDNVKQELKSLKALIAALNPSQEKESKRFKVPKEHPVFDGTAATLEMFIREMEFTHPEYTSGSAAKESSSGFISKLVPYFKEGTGARVWFKMLASKWQRGKKKKTWARLVKSYGLNTANMTIQDHDSKSFTKCSRKRT